MPFALGESWVEDLVRDCNGVETPTSWLWWSAVCAISAVAGNNYHLRTLNGAVIYKPNIYVMLLGESGLGKGYPINLAKILVSKSETTRVIAGRSSIQAIVKELSLTRSRNGSHPILDSRGFIVNGELSSAIIADVDALAILTDLYDGHYNKEWVNLLKGEGAEKLKEPYITALFGSSMAHFYDTIPQANIEGGYIGRNLIVYEEKRSKNVDLLDEGDEIDDRIYEYLVPKYLPQLLKIASLKGKLIPSPQARALYNTWRRKWREEQTYDKTGFINRVPDHVLKTAMCLCLARYNGGAIIDEFDMQESITQVTRLVYASKRSVEGKGLDPLATQTKMVLDFLLRADKHELKRRELLSKGYGSYDTSMLDKVLETLMELGWVRRERFTAGKASDWIIHLAGEPLENYKRYVKDQEGKK
jgi:hypothetical protein